MGQVQGEAAIITGGASGIGAACAETPARGAAVFPRNGHKHIQTKRSSRRPHHASIFLRVHVPRLSRGGSANRGGPEEHCQSDVDISRYENGADAYGETLIKQQSALKAAGLIFLDENGEGPGARLKKRS